MIHPRSNAVKMADDLMVALLIDDEGIEYDSNSPELRRRLKFSAGKTDFSDNAVRERGYMEVRGTARHCTVRMNPVIALQPTCTAVLDILTELDPDRVNLKWYNGSWQDEILRPCQKAMERIVELSKTMPRPQRDDCRQAVREQASLDVDDPLLTLCKMWTRGERDHRKFLAALVGDLEGRYLLVRVDNDTRQMYLDDVGPGFWLLDRSWLDRVLAQGNLLDQPDANYAERILDTFRMAFDGGVPIVHEVDTIINSPNDGRMRARYRRVMLPLPNEEGPSWLLSTSYLDEGIDLRSEG